MRSFFAVKRIRLIWLDIFVERLNREEKSNADWTNRQILEQIEREETKKTKLLVSSLPIKSQSMVPFASRKKIGSASKYYSRRAYYDHG